MFDLHFHSLASDGKADFGTIVRRLRQRPELRLVALADHDAIGDSVRLAALDPRAWVGVELATNYRGVGVDLLALNVDPYHAPLVHYLRQRTVNRATRFGRIGQALRQEGWRFQPVALTSGSQISKRHVAAELLRHHSNLGRLAALGVPVALGTRRDIEISIYRRVLDALPATDATMIPIVDAIKLTHAAGGLAVLAHPALTPYDQGRADLATARRSITELAAAGLDGLEVFHESADSTLRDELVAQAATHGLLVTAGSDDHTADLGGLGTRLPANHPRAADWLADLRAAAERRRQRPAA